MQIVAQSPISIETAGHSTIKIRQKLGHRTTLIPAETMSVTVCVSSINIFPGHWLTSHVRLSDIRYLQSELGMPELNAPDPSLSRTRSSENIIFPTVRNL
jgi:hypothetical protein